MLLMSSKRVVGLGNTKIREVWVVADVKCDNCG